MQLPSYVTPMGVISIGLMSTLFIFLANIALRKVGLNNLTVAE